MNKINIKILFIVFLFIIAFIAVFALSFLARQDPTIPSDPQPFPTLSPTSDTTQINSVIRVFPAENTRETYLPIQQIEIQFSSPVLAQNIVVSSSPDAFIKVGQVAPDTIILSPDPFWTAGETTTIVLSNNQEGNTPLEEDFTYRIFTDHPAIPEFVD